MGGGGGGGGGAAGLKRAGAKLATIYDNDFESQIKQTYGLRDAGFITCCWPQD